MSLIAGSGAKARQAPNAGTSTISGYVRARKGIDFGSGASNCFDMESHVDGLAFPIVTDVIGKQQLVGYPVFLVDPCQAGDAPLKTATIRQNPPDSATAANDSFLHTVGLVYLVNASGQFSKQGSGNSLEGGMASNSALVTQDAHVLTPGATSPGTYANLAVIGTAQLNVTSGLNASQTTIIDLHQLVTSLSVNMVTSAGTASLTISASPDNTNYLTVDSIAAAAATAKIYGSTTAGATTAIAPLSYRYVKIVAGAAGVGNTTTQNIGAK
jgi:uncharacterized membrane protein